MPAIGRCETFRQAFQTVECGTQPDRYVPNDGIAVGERIESKIHIILTYGHLDLIWRSVTANPIPNPLFDLFHGNHQVFEHFVSESPDLSSEYLVTQRMRHENL